jgi:predicted house-cleaning NTP pyrophosphatase (Maf/HAM1 superfamily)
MAADVAQETLGGDVGLLPPIVLCLYAVVVHQDAILEKATDAAEAATMVRACTKSGETMLVYTAIAAAVSRPRVVAEAVNMTRDLTEDEVRRYLADPRCIESSGALIVEILLESGAVALDGDVSSVMGFPQTAVRNIVAALKSKI